MRLAENEISTGLMHDNVIVREEVASYFARTKRVQPDITRKVIEAVDHFGWRDVFRWSYRVSVFQLDEELMPWALDQIQRADDGAPDKNLRKHLARMVSSAPIQVLRSHSDRLLADDFFHRQLSPRAEDPTPAATIQQRLDIHALSAETCWSELQAHCETIASVKTFQEANIPKCQILIDRIVEDREFSRSHQHVIVDLLANTTSRPGDASEWLVGLMVILAGRLQLADAIPHIYRHYKEDWDWYNEEVTQALLHIGTEKVQQYVAERYSTEPWYIRNYAHSIFEVFYTESVLKHVGSLLEQEDDDFLRGNLGVAAASHFDSAGIELARSVYLEDPEDSERQKIIELLVAHSYLNALELPERDQWEQKINQEWKRFERQLRTESRGLAQAIKHGSTTANSATAIAGTARRIDQNHKTPKRNDACPCGSGKKYKKCCMRKSPL